MKPSDLNDDEAIASAALLGAEFLHVEALELWSCWDPNDRIMRSWCYKTRGDAARAFLKGTLAP